MTQLHTLTNEQRTKALALASILQPCKRGDDKVAHLIHLERVTTVADYLSDGSACAKQIEELNREPYLLIEDTYNCDVQPIEIYDGSAEMDSETGKYILDLHKGLVLLDGDVVVYWK